MTTSTTFSTFGLVLVGLVIGLVLGLVLGLALGWFARATRYPHHQPPAPPDIPLDGTAIRAQVEPLEKNLAQAIERLAQQMHAIEAGRAVEISTLGAQLQAITRSSARISDRTEKLVTALRSPNVRGRWGEVQLERVVEMGGMTKHVDFDPQVTATIDGRQVRPDLVINLAGGRHLVVDAKVPFSSYIDAIEAIDPEEHAALMRRHAHHLRSHVQALAHRDYLGAFAPMPEFVVMFVPADPFLDAALGVDPTLLEFAFDHNVVIATPTTLFALLRTVALGWRNEDLSEKAREVQRLGQELYGRLVTMGEHFNRVGTHLEKTIEAFNSTLGSLDSRVMVTARRLSELDIPARSNQPIPPLKTVSDRPRHYQPRHENTGNTAAGG